MSRITSVEDCRSIREGDILVKESNNLTYTVGRNDGQTIYLTPIDMPDTFDGFRLQTGYLPKTYESLISDEHWLHYPENQVSQSSIDYHGQAYAQDEKKFDNLLDEIERRHIDYFASRESKIGKNHDGLHEHIIYGNNSNGSVFFNKLPDSELPEDIYQECINAFKSIFGNS